MATIDIKMGKLWCNNSDVAFSSKHEMTLFEILIRNIHTPLPLRGPHDVRLKHHIIINKDWMIIYQAQLSFDFQPRLGIMSKTRAKFEAFIDPQGKRPNIRYQYRLISHNFQLHRNPRTSKACISDYVFMAQSAPSMPRPN